MGRLGPIDPEAHTRSLTMPRCALHYDIFPNVSSGSSVLYYSNKRPEAELPADDTWHDDDHNNNAFDHNGESGVSSSMVNGDGSDSLHHAEVNDASECRDSNSNSRAQCHSEGIRAGSMHNHNAERIFLGVWKPQDTGEWAKTDRLSDIDRATDSEFELQLPWFSDCFDSTSCLLYMRLEASEPRDYGAVVEKHKILLIVDEY